MLIREVAAAGRWKSIFYRERIMFRKAALIGFILGIMPAFVGSAAALTLQDALSKARENLPSYQAVKKGGGG